MTHKQKVYMPKEAQKWSARYLSSSIIFYFINFRFYLSAIVINTQAKIRIFFSKIKKNTRISKCSNTHNNKHLKPYLSFFSNAKKK